jgi:hypothetical protein
MDNPQAWFAGGQLVEYFPGIIPAAIIHDDQLGVRNRGEHPALQLTQSVCDGCLLVVGRHDAAQRDWVGIRHDSNVQSRIIPIEDGGGKPK